MAISESQKLSIAKYRQEKRDRLSTDIPKGKRAEYNAAAGHLGISLALLVQNGVEEYIRNHAGEEFKPTTTQDKQPRLSANEQELLEIFSRLPDDAQKGFIKSCKAINQLIDTALDERNRYCGYWITASDAKRRLEEEVEKLKKNKPAD